MTDPNTTAFATEQQQRAEAAVKAKEILYKPGFGAARITAFEVVQLAQFILTGAVPPLPMLQGDAENGEEKGTHA